MDYILLCESQLVPPFSQMEWGACLTQWTWLHHHLILSATTPLLLRDPILLLPLSAVQSKLLNHEVTAVQSRLLKLLPVALPSSFNTAQQLELSVHHHVSHVNQVFT